MYNTFVLSYDPLSNKFTQNQLLAFVRANALTYQYYAPSLGTYLIKSAANTIQMVDAYGGFFDGSNFFLAQVFPTLTGGALPLEIWDWVNAPTPPPLIGQS